MQGHCYMNSSRTSITEISVTRVSKVFSTGVTALGDISFSVSKGSFVTILGPSGCGKSTLLRMVAGLLSTTSGTITLKGVAVTEPPAGMVYLFQQYTKSLFPWLTVLKNVEFGAASPHAKSRGKPLGRDDCLEYLRLVGLDTHANSYPWQLSGGMQQRVAIARALVAQPEVLLMDEPFSALDALTRESLQDLLLRLWEELDLTVIFVTHDISEAIYLSDRILVLGKAPSAILAEEEVQLPRPRDQLTTRESGDFLGLRRSLYQMVIAKPGAA
jgi:NitT/TauT family transport system ATP-binding protein